MKTHPYRRVALASVALALPLSALALTSPATSASPQPVSVTIVESADREAAEAELEADRAEAAVPVARAKVKPALEQAQKSRVRVTNVKKNVDKLVKRLQNQRNVAKNAKNAKKRANARKRVKNIQVRVKNRRATLRKIRVTNNANWQAWNQAKANREAAIAYVAEARETAVELRRVADEVRAAHTVVTSLEATVLPAIHQPGVNVSKADNAKGVVAVSAEPAVPLLDVSVYATNGSQWKQVATNKTGADGRASFVVPEGDRFRVDVGGKSIVVNQERTLDYSDEFTGNRLTSDWVHRMQMHRPESKRACSKGSPEAVTNTGDTVRLWVKKDTSRKANCAAFYNGKYYPGHSYRLNGHIGTQGTYDFTYGVAAARMKFQSAEDGQHAAFWLQPSSYAPGGFGPDYQGAEIDVVEFTGYKPKPDVGRMHMGAYANDANGNLKQSSSGILPDDVVKTLVADKDDKWFNRYHVFSVEWTPTEYVFRVDGTEVFRTSENVSSRPQYPILSLLSSDYAIARAGAEGEKILGSQNMEVDWVRVWR